jgi:hypothetical protein
MRPGRLTAAWCAPSAATPTTCSATAMLPRGRAEGPHEDGDRRAPAAAAAPNGRRSADEAPTRWRSGWSSSAQPQRVALYQAQPHRPQLRRCPLRPARAHVAHAQPVLATSVDRSALRWPCPDVRAPARCRCRHRPHGHCAGANPLASNGSLDDGAGVSAAQRARRGGSWWWWDHGTETANGDRHVPIRPGTDAFCCWRWCTRCSPRTS